MPVHARWRRGILCVLGGAVVLLATVILIGLTHGSLAIGGDGAVPMSGVKVPLDVTFTNGFELPISVTNLQVSVQAVTAPNAARAHQCSADDFVVNQMSPPVTFTLGAGSTTSLSRLHLPGATWPQVRILRRMSSQDACLGASVTLAYTASRTLRLL